MCSFVYISVASISDTGYWEGSVGEREGWFPSEHVQEVRLRHKGGYRLLTMQIMGILDMLWMLPLIFS